MILIIDIYHSLYTIRECLMIYILYTHELNEEYVDSFNTNRYRRWNIAFLLTVNAGPICTVQLRLNGTFFSISRLGIAISIFKMKIRVSVRAACKAD